MTRYSVIALALLVAGTANAAEKTVDKTFTVSAGGSLIVDVDSASVHVSGGPGNQVIVHARVSASDDDLASMNLDVSQKDNDVNVTLRQPGTRGWFGRSWHGDARIEVTVPSQYRINVHTSGGNVGLDNTVGPASVHTSGGDLSARNVTGNLEMRTSGGAIHVDTLRGDVDAGTSGGNVRLLHVDGKIKGDTSGGDVECSLVGANRGVLATTSGGSIRLILPKATAASIEAKTSGGQIKSEIPIAMTEFREGHVSGTINGGGQPIEARTSGGDINLRVEN